MKILMIHKFYYIEGGAERYVFNLTHLLENKGHTVIPFAVKHPDNFETPYQEYFADYFSPEQFSQTRNPLKRITTAQRVIYNRRAQQKLAQLIKDTRPDIAHVHSIYHHLSPSVLQTLKDFNLPVMMTLHDYKLVCPNYIFLDGKRRVCEACRGKHFWQAMVRKCFRDSYAASFLTTVEAYFHYFKKSYKNNVDVLVSPSQFLAEKISQYGYAHKPVLVQPYTLNISEYKPSFFPLDYFVFMGRLTHEKGVHFLLDAMNQIKDTSLYIIGTGPIEEKLKRRIKEQGLSNVKMLGYKSGDELKRLVAGAKFTVVPSEWHDNSPLVIYESLALGKPVIGSRMGGIPELIDEDGDGFVFDRGDLSGFVNVINSLVHDQKKLSNMGKRAREKAEFIFGFDNHYHKIIELYELTRSVSSSDN